jgi:pimeloyl-ACP methyl ester carboxylesterase
MYVDEAGDPAAPTVVLLHGGGVGGWMWRHHVERLCARWHVLVPDLPEQGRSLTDKPITVERAAGLVAGLIEERAGGTAHLGGLSLGAQVAVEVLASRPELVARALVTGALVKTLPGASTIKAMTAPYWPFRNISALVRWNMRALEIPDEYFEDFARDTRSATLGSFSDIMRANMTFGLPDGLERARVPVLVAVGESEPAVMKESQRELLGVLPEAEGVLVRGHGHNWPIEAPDLFTAALEAWLTHAPLPAELEPVAGTVPTGRQAEVAASAQGASLR